MATRIWNPKAADVPDVYTITIGGTWAANDTLTIECGSTKGVTIDLGASGSTTTANIAAEVAAILVAQNKRDGVGTGYTWSHGALEYGEFHDIVDVSVSGSVVTIEGPPGIPITITGSETSTSGTVTVAHPQEATGLHFWDNADNWGGTVPVDADAIVIANTSIGPQYSLPQTALELIELFVDMSFTGMIGLPIINRRDVNNPYQEYRDRFAFFRTDAATTADNNIYIGQGTGQGPRLVNISLSHDDVANTTQVHVFNAAPPVPNVSTHTVNIETGATGTNFDFYLQGGTVQINGDGNSGEVGDVTVDGNAVVLIDSGTSNVVSVAQSSGDCTVRLTAAASFTTWTQTGGTARIMNGSYTTLNVLGGTMQFIDANSVTNLNVAGPGVFDASIGGSPVTVTNTSGYGNGMINDPKKRLTHTNGVDYVQTGTDLFMHNQGRHFTLTRTAI